MRYDCEVVITASDGRHIRWESIVSAADIRHGVELVHAHAEGLYPGCKINDLLLLEIEPGDPLDAVPTQGDGVHNINDLSEVVRGPQEGELKRLWRRMSRSNAH